MPQPVSWLAAMFTPVARADSENYLVVHIPGARVNVLQLHRWEE
jgi:hypothetical protein